jgi:hypothetical protein
MCRIPSSVINKSGDSRQIIVSAERLTVHGVPTGLILTVSTNGSFQKRVPAVEEELDWAQLLRAGQRADGEV